MIITVHTNCILSPNSRVLVGKLDYVPPLTKNKPTQMSMVVHLPFICTRELKL